MKSKSRFRMLATVLAALVPAANLAAQARSEQAMGGFPRYALIDLESLPGGPFSQAAYLSDFGLPVGIVATAKGVQHAAAWPDGILFDVGTPGLKGPNSGLFGINAAGVASGQAESSASDPNNENFCAYGTGLKCLPAAFQHGVMTALPLLGGNNGTVGNVNSQGEIPGVAETGTKDSSCPTKPQPTGVGPLVFDFKAVVWGPKPKQIRRLGTLGKDTVSIALWINDKGQAVGVSGSCANTNLPPFSAGPHAVLWQKDGSAHDLGNLGGTIDEGTIGSGNVALAINNLGQIVGASVTPSGSPHAFLWTPEQGRMVDLETLDGDPFSGAQGIDDRGEIVGSSGADLMHSRAFVWKDGMMMDLNQLVPAKSPLYLVDAAAINASGVIAGIGATQSGDIHTFLAIPCDWRHAGEAACKALAASKDHDAVERDLRMPDNIQWPQLQPYLHR